MDYFFSKQKGLCNLKPLDLALEYMNVVFGGGDVGQLNNLLAEDCSFEGPFYHFENAADYIDSLKTDPPQDFGHTIIRAFQDETSACLVYQFSKPGVDTPMAQLFETDNGRISKILLVFDSAPFLQNNNNS